jgi:hypothetical protein
MLVKPFTASELVRAVGELLAARGSGVSD